MLAEINWIFTIPASIFGTLCLTISLVLCACGCRTKQAKDELVGVEGRVKITNPDEYPQEVNANNNSTEVMTDKVQNTAKRSLPDLPVDSHANGRSDVTWEPIGDATSELYATVVLQDDKNKEHIRHKSESGSLSPSVMYTKVNEIHPYDKLKKVEHPYAQVKGQENENIASCTSHLINNSNKKEEKNTEELKLDSADSRRTGNELSCNIPAATAITGNITASDDLPYMTPPTHFSGDSQDSGKGYTSISVREPLSAIRGENNSTTNRLNDPHYATVSDDSDDMYAAIDDPNQTYTSESETYAQIHTGTNKSKPAPQPPSVDSLKQMTITSQSHSRQASSSSLTSSTAISSPKPEKRPANSPLPPTPTKSPDSIDEASQNSDKNLKLSSSLRNVEDMYAKVNKKVKREIDHFERGGSTESGVSESSGSLNFKLRTSTSESARSCHSFLSKSTLTDTTSSNGQIATDSFSSETDPPSGYEKLDGSSYEFDRKSDPGYETVNKMLSSESDLEYEKLKPQKHDYVNIERNKGQNQDYAETDKLEIDSNDGYARVKNDFQETEIYSKIDACESDGYARVELHEHEVTNDDGYAKVKKFNNNKSDPNYEKMLFTKQGDKTYCEPTYESLGNELETDDPSDPNYESVEFAQKALAEPPYQLLRECESGVAEE